MANELTSFIWRSMITSGMDENLFMFKVTEIRVDMVLCH